MARINTPVILDVKDLEIHYGLVRAVKGVSFEVRESEVVVLLGANGAGKTSVLKGLSGTVGVEGAVLFEGKNITNKEAEQIAALGIIQSPEGRQLFGNLTVEENLRIGAFTIKSKEEIKQNLERVYRYFPILQERYKQIAATLSGGEQQMLAIARALMGSPKLLILDEPSLGLAPIIVQQIFSILKEIKNEKTTILIVEQNALQTLKMADYTYVFEVGKITKEGASKDLIKDKSLVEAYLGKRH
ncbi:MAG TPA: ABC transporter ATP-binding protein [Bacilli bacterium]|nr:ABC transporter ATP-binding protein [Bacilli bacterium]